MFGRESEHLFLRHIVGFIPRTRLEEGEEGEVEEGQGKEEESEGKEEEGEGQGKEG